MATKNPMDKMLAPFGAKGALVKVMEPCMHDRDGNIVKEGKFDLMEREFRPYNLHGQTDTGSPDVAGNEADFVEVAREARDLRLVGMSNGQVLRAAGSLSDGTGMLFDADGRRIVNGSVQQAPVRPARRSPKDW